LRLIVNDVEKARTALKEKGYTVNKTEVVAVEVPDRPGGLSKILQTLDANQINVEYMYAFVERRGDFAVIIFRFDDTARAVEVLRERSFKTIEGEHLYSM
jgi:hypothetical protein